MPKAYAYFSIVSEELPLEEITDLMGIQPTESWLKGSPGEYIKERKVSFWGLHSPLPRTNTNLEEHINAVLGLLKPRENEVRMLSEKYDTYLVCTGEYDGTASPGLFLSKENVSLISSLGLAIDADLYFG